MYKKYKNEIGKISNFGKKKYMIFLKCDLVNMNKRCI